MTNHNDKPLGAMERVVDIEAASCDEACGERGCADRIFLLRAFRAMETIAAQRAKTIHPPTDELVEQRKKDLATELELYFENG